MSNTTFSKLLNDVLQKGILTEDDPTILEIYLNIRFNEWLKKAKGWNGENDTWENLTTQENFALYLKDEALYTDGSLKGLIELYELRFEQNLILHRQERKERGQETTLEDEYYCRIRTLKNEQRRNDQFFSNKYPNGKPKGFEPEKRHAFHWDEKKKFEKWVQVESIKFEKLLNSIFNYKELKDSTQDQFDKNYILEMKKEAIKKTLLYFSKFGIHSIDSNQLSLHLEKENNFIIVQIENSQNLIKQGRVEDLKKRLKEYLDNIVLELNNFEVNKGNRIENSKNNLLEIAQDYCILKLHFLLHTEQLIKINSNVKDDKILNKEQETPKKFIANEYALAYIFDLYVNGKQIPVNRTDGGYNKKELIQIGFELYQIDKMKDTFYRAVKKVVTYDLNKQKDLALISQNWLEAVKTLSKDWNKTQQYLIDKKLIGE